MNPESSDPYRTNSPPPAPKKTGLAAIGVAVLALLSKGKSVFVLFKALPFAKMLLTFGSFGLTTFAYAFRSGWAFAFGFTLLIMVHELGHAYAMKAAGVRASWPVFIPFLGAFIAMKDAPVSDDDEARIAIAGPVAGTAGALVCAALGLFLHSRFFFALAYMAFFLNLFNLVPFGFLDGARVARVFSRGAWIAGLLLMGGLFFLSPSPQLLIIGLMGLTQTFRRAQGADSVYVTADQRRSWAIRYFALVAFLGLAMYFTRSLLDDTGLS